MSLLTVDGLTCRFGGLIAVNEFATTFAGGEIAALIGPNGAGKTTVFNLISGFYTPSAGSIVFDGKSTVGKKPHQVAAVGIARTFQNIRLWPQMNVLDNCRVAKHAHLGYGVLDSMWRGTRFAAAEKAIREHCLEILEIMGLADFAEEFPPNLSYGLQRRVEIARALCLEPKLLLLDEPAAGLPSTDLTGLIDLIAFIHERFKLTVWMIEHQMQLVMSLASKIQVLNFGAVIAEGDPETIRNDPTVIKAYLGDENLGDA